MKGNLYTFVLSVLSIMCTILLVFSALQVTSQIWQHNDDPLWLSHYIEIHDSVFLVKVLLSLSLLITVGFPRQFISFFCGVAFGAVNGTLLAWLLTLFASTLAYGFARGPLRLLTRKVLKNRLVDFQARLTTQSFKKILLIRLFPIGSNVVTNMLAGSLRVPFTSFVLASALGFLPQTLFFALLGSGMRYVLDWQQPIQIICLIISILLVLSLIGVLKKKNQHADE